MAREDLTQDELRSLVLYDPESGFLTWLRRKEAKSAYEAASLTYAKEFSIHSQEPDMSKQTVNVTMTVEEVSKRWLSQKNLCAVDWDTLSQLCDVYRDHGHKTLVFDASNLTYALRDKVSDDKPKVALKAV